MPDPLYELICQIYPKACGRDKTEMQVLEPLDQIRQLAASVRAAKDGDQGLYRINALVQFLISEGELDPALKLVQELQNRVPQQQYTRSAEFYLIEADIQLHLRNNVAGRLAFDRVEEKINLERGRLGLNNVTDAENQPW
jgi:hypothetical protein